MLALIFALLAVIALLLWGWQKMRESATAGGGGGNGRVALAGAASLDAASSDDDDAPHGALIPRGRLAKAKAARDKKKEERRGGNEAALAQERRRRDEAAQRRHTADRSSELAEAREEERLAIIQEKKVKREAEEAARWEADMQVCEGGDTYALSDGGSEAPQGVLGADGPRFAEEVARRKVVHLEPLAADFGVSVETCMEAIRTFEADGVFSGVFDDRGKYIVITPEEYLKAAEYIKGCGRVSIESLTAKSAQIISMSGEA